MKRTVISLVIVFCAIPTWAQQIPSTLGGAPPQPGQERTSEESGCPPVSGWGEPAGLLLAAVPDGIRISWFASPGAPTEFSGFQILRSTELNGPYLPVGVVGRSTTEFVDATAVPGTIYYYRVRTFAGELCSPLSTPISGQR